MDTPTRGGSGFCKAPGCQDETTWWTCLSCGGIACRAHQQFNGRVVTACFACSEDYKAWDLAMARQYDKPCNKCGVQITMREDTQGKWAAYEFQSNQKHQCKHEAPATPVVTNTPTTPVTQQPKLQGGSVIVGGFTPEVEKWIVNLVKRAMKEYMEAST